MLFSTELAAKTMHRMSGVWMTSMLVASSPVLVCTFIPAITAMTNPKSAATEMEEETTMAMRFILVLYVLISALTLLYGNAIYFLNVAYGKSPNPMDITIGFRRMYDVVVASVLVVAVVAVGCVFFVVPGIIAAAGLSMTFFIMVDEQALSARQAVVRSWELTWGQGLLWKALAFEVLWVSTYFIVGTALQLVLGLLAGPFGAMVAVALRRSFLLAFLLAASWAYRSCLYQELVAKTTPAVAEKYSVRASG
eukprot:EG_transcript_11144